MDHWFGFPFGAGFYNLVKVELGLQRVNWGNQPARSNFGPHYKERGIYTFHVSRRHPYKLVALTGYGLTQNEVSFSRPFPFYWNIPFFSVESKKTTEMSHSTQSSSKKRKAVASRRLYQNMELEVSVDHLGEAWCLSDSRTGYLFTSFCDNSWHITRDRRRAPFVKADYDSSNCRVLAF